LNVLSLIFVTALGTAKLVNAQPQNAPSPMPVILFKLVIAANFAQLKKALLPTEVVALATVMEARFEQPEKAPLPIAIAVPFMVADVNPVQLLKA
jgi:hypothetical protein